MAADEIDAIAERRRQEAQRRRHALRGQQHLRRAAQLSHPGRDLARSRDPQSCDKKFYASPFMAMAMAYHFRVAPPVDSVAIAIRQDDAAGPMLHANFVGDRVALSDRSLVTAFLRHPLSTLKIIGGIHWEAMKLLLKGVRLVPHPAPPEHAVTIVPLESK
jgi:DUF1365 family protein